MSEQKTLQDCLLSALNSDHLPFSIRVVAMPAFMKWHAQETERLSGELQESIDIMRQIASCAMQNDCDSIMKLLKEFQEKIQ